jgi:hypothetical protein
MRELTSVKIKAPLGSYRSDRSEAQALNELSLTKKRALSIIEPIANIHGVPLNFAFAFTCIETMGLALRSADGLSYGMMQTNAATLDGVIKSAFKMGMSIEDFKYVYYACKPAFRVKPNAKIPPLNWGNQQFIGNISDIGDQAVEKAKIMAQPVRDVLIYANPTYILSTGGGYTSPYNIFNRKMNSDPSFGIHIGCMYLYELIVKSLQKEGDVEYIRTDWVINGYNGGYYSKFNPWMNSAQGKLEPNTWLAQPNVPSVTKAYVKRLAGIGGYLELIKNGKFVL